MSRGNQKFYQVMKVQQWPNKPIPTRRQFPHPFLNHQATQKTMPNGQIMGRRIWPAWINRARQKPVTPFKTNRLLRTRTRQPKAIPQQRKRLRSPQTNRQQRNQVRAQQLNQQQRNRVKAQQLIQQQRRRMSPSHPNPAKRSFQQKKEAGQIKFFTPQELLLFAPRHNLAMWELIVNRLPLDYSLPDPQFLQIYRSYNN